MTRFELVTSSLPRKRSTPELHRPKLSKTQSFFQHQNSNASYNLGSKFWLERETGFEPATFSLEGWRSTNWATPAFYPEHIQEWYSICQPNRQSRLKGVQRYWIFGCFQNARTVFRKQFSFAVFRGQESLIEVSIPHMDYSALRCVPFRGTLNTIVLFHSIRKQAFNGLQKHNFVGRAGFEPAKVKTNRFTVCPRWPLEYLPKSAANILLFFFYANKNKTVFVYFFITLRVPWF